MNEDLLTKLEFTDHQMKICDALLFFQVVCLMFHPSKSYIFNYPRIPYFTYLESFTNIYKFSTGQGASYGHEWKNSVVTDIFQFNGILVRDGVIGGNNGYLCEQWNPNSPMYIPNISQAMTLTRFGEIKRKINLCNNNASNIRYQEGYDPAYKFDLPYKAFVANNNAISKKADENQVIDDFS